MKRALTICALVVLASASLFGQTAKPGPVPRTADGHPDLNGVWWRGSDLNVRPLADAPTPPPAAGARGAAPAAAPQRPQSFTDLYTPEALAKRKTLSDKDDPTLRCIPTAFGTLNVSLFGEGFLGQIVQTPKFVVMLKETFHGYKIVPIDGRPHRDDTPPVLRGDSIGRWEGDTLVVDTTNFTDTNWIFAEGNVSFHSDAMHVIERYRMTDADTLEIEAIVEDPKVLKESWKVPKQTLKRAPFDQILEVGCTGTETYSLMQGASKENYGRK